MVAYGGRCPAFVPLFLDLERAGIPEPKGKGAPKALYVAACWGLILDRAIERDGQLIAEVSERAVARDLRTKWETVKGCIDYLVKVGRLRRLGRALLEVVPVYEANAPKAEHPNAPKTEQAERSGAPKTEQAMIRKRSTAPKTERSKNGALGVPKTEQQRSENGALSTLSRDSENQKLLLRESESASGESPAPEQPLPPSPLAADGAPRPSGSPTVTEGVTDSRGLVFDPLEWQTPDGFFDLRAVLEAFPWVAPPATVPEDREHQRAFLAIAANAEVLNRQANPNGKPVGNAIAVARTVYRDMELDHKRAVRELKAADDRLRAEEQAEAREAARKTRQKPVVALADFLVDEELDAPSEGFEGWLKKRQPQAWAHIAELRASDPEVEQLWRFVAVRFEGVEAVVDDQGVEIEPGRPGLVARSEKAYAANYQRQQGLREFNHGLKSALRIQEVSHAQS